MKYLYSIFFLVLLSYLQAFSIWQRNIINYERSSYQAGSQNWMIAQDKNGWMYFANSKGLLEFDGVYWNLYPVDNKVVRSLKIIGERIYIGANFEFGFFERNNIGNLEYHSLSDSLANQTGNIWSISAIGDKIYFLADNTIYIYSKSNQDITTISTEVKIDYCSTAINEKLYLATTDGLFYLNNGCELTLVEQSRPVIGEKIVGLRGYNDGLMVTTSRAGIFFMNEEGCSRIKTTADSFIQQNQLFCSAIIGSKMILGSVQNGAFIFDLDDPYYKEYFNIDTGLKNNTILSVLSDREQNLWLGLDRGIGYIDLNSPIHPLFPVNSPIGAGYCSIKYNGEMYLGTNQGLYILDKDGNYRMIKDSEGQVWSLNIIDGVLFSSGDNGVLVITPTRSYKIKLMGTWSVEKVSSEKDVLIAATYLGFRLIDKVDGIWKDVRVVKGFNRSSRGFVEDEISNVFWVANAGDNIERITINPKSGEMINNKSYNLGNGNVGENVSFRKIHNNLVICGEKGIYQYSRISDEFVPHPQLESMLDGQQYYDFLDADSLGNIWFVSDKKLKMLPFVEGNYSAKKIEWGLGNELIDSSENINLLDSGSAIVSVDKGFVKIDMTKRYSEALPVNTFIRKLVTTSNDSIVSYNSFGGMLQIPYSRNSINIYFSATSYSQNRDITYSYRIKDIDEKWSPLSSKTIKEYTNLSEGKYVFEVKTFVNGTESQGNVASVAFEILPPWYRSAWAYFIYILLFIIFIVILYRNTIKKQKLIIAQKGRELEMQTKLYEKERILKDKEIYELQNENLKVNLNFKTQELTGYILNLIRKNEMLEEVKREVMNISKSLDDNKQPSIIKQKVIRLTTQINNNIEKDKDFEVFQSNFDLIHKDFFKLLDEQYPGLTRNDKILCAYLKMNLSTKEIAPLQNITVRGVEVNRYRLRKKMNLDREVNLTDFLQNLEQTEASES